MAKQSRIKGIACVAFKMAGKNKDWYHKSWIIKSKTDLKLRPNELITSQVRS